MFDGWEADDGYVKTHILTRFTYLDDNQRLAVGDAGGTIDGFVGAFHGFHGHARAVGDYDRLADVHGGDLACHA